MKRNSCIGLFIISMCVVVLGLVGIGYANHQGFDCLVCHDSVDTRNLSFIREVISTPNSGPREVWFTAYTGWRSYADGDTVYDGVCEVCHTITHYHTNYDNSTTHFDGQDCIRCHPHTNDFYPTLPARQSHLTHFSAPQGPQINYDCSVCHGNFSDSLFADGNPLATTTVCDPCHSPGGAFDGVNDPVIGAKLNWDDGIYEPAVPPEEWPSRLKVGKENWCAGCHDDGISVINGVSAPNVMGDNTTYGYTVSGHGEYAVRCDDCHDLTMLHTDGQARTYSASSDNYREGYRLNADMAIPRNGEYGPMAFQLCMNCHDYSDIMGTPSNFRDDNIGVQLHETHLNLSFAHMICWDSDWNQNANNCNQGECAESAISCTACHNVHGSPTPAMIRHGELISTPGTTDKVPALRFRWYKADGTQTMVLDESRYGGLLCGTTYNVSFNHVCWGCHPAGELRYYRTPPIGHSPAAFSFTATQGGSNPPNQSLSIWNTGDGTLNWIVNDNATWLSLYPIKGIDRGTVRVSVDISGLTAGTYNALIVIKAINAAIRPVNIPVTLTVNPPPTIGYSPTSFSFTATQGGSNPPNQSLSISNTGGGTLSWSVSDDVTWLTLNPISGTDSGTVTLSANIAGITAGTYNALITITAAGATNSPVSIPVTLTVNPPPPTIGYNPTSFNFSATQGGSNPPDQTLSISNTGSGTLNWSVSVDATWLSLNPTNGTNSGTVTLSVNIAGLPEGTYNATITVTAAGATNSPVSIPVTLTVNAPSIMITLLAPNGGEVIPSGSTYTIRWNAPPTAVKFTLRYSINNGSTWILIANNVRGSSYNWRVPKPLNNKRTCLVKVVGFNSAGTKVGEDISDSTFTIEVIELTSPDGGEVLHQGNTWKITWRTNGTASPVAQSLLYYSTNGTTYKLITPRTGNPGSYLWSVPYVSSTRCKVKVVLKNASGATVGNDVSDGLFTIQP